MIKQIPLRPAKKILILLTLAIIGFLFLPHTSSTISNSTLDNPITEMDNSRNHEGDTFSIVAYDPVTGQIGGAACSCFNGTIDFLSDAVRDPDTGVLLGAIHTQASYNATNQAAARTRMEAGDTPQEIIDWLVANDPGSGTIGSRQYGIVGIDAGGTIRTAGYTGATNGNWANHLLGPTYSIQGNILDTSTGGGGRDDILQDMETAFLNATGTLADRLMAALQGAKRVGADNRCVGSGNSGKAAFVKVLDPSDPNDTSPSLEISVFPNINAVEPIDVLQCDYDTSVGNTGFFCRETINSYPYIMDFETQSWETEATCNTRNAWIRSRFATPDANTGPSAASEGALYAFVESSDLGPDNFNNRVVIGSPCFEIPAGETTLINFDYHMFGATMGSLALTVNDGSGWTTLWSLSGDQGNSWQNQEVDLSAYAGSTIKLRMDATTGNGATSDMAVDNISIYQLQPVNCSTTISSANILSYSESFENTLGDWLQATNDDGDWLLNENSTPSNTTGPSTANDGTFYLYIEASDVGVTPGAIGTPNKNAILESPCFDLTANSGAFFMFDYHNFGDTPGVLELEVSTIEGIWTNVFTSPNISEDAWKTVSLDISGYNEPIKLRFIGTTGTTFSSDLAIDNIRIIPATCSSITQYNSGGWNNGVPTNSSSAIIASDYNTTTIGANIDACELIVTNNATLTITADQYVSSVGNITVDAGASLIIEHQGSLVQSSNSATVTNNGTINVQMTTPVLQTRDFMVMGSPMSNETRSGVYNSAFLVLNQSPSNFIPHPNVPSGGTSFADDNGNFMTIYNGNINVGEGYIVRPQDSYTDPANESYNFTHSQGTLNNGVINRTVIYNGTNDNADRTPNVLANPYPSAISANDFISNNALVNEVYFWEHLTPPSSNIPGYGGINFSMDDISMYNLSGGTKAANDLSAGEDTTPNGVISTGQGFGVQINGGATAGTGTVSFNNSMRLTTGNNTLRNSLPPTDRIWLNVENQEYELGSSTLIAFNPTATEQLDSGYDSERLSTAISIYSHLYDGSEKLGIQTLGVFNEDIKISLGFATQIPSDGADYTISLADIEGANLANATVYLIDHQLEVTTNLSETDYTFQAFEGTFDTRFTLQFEPENILSTVDHTLEQLSLFPNPTSDELTIISPKEKVMSAIVYDLRGRKVQEVDFTSKGAYQLNLTNLENAMYLVRIKTKSGIINKRVIKQ